MRALLDATVLGSGLGGDETMVRGALRGLAATSERGDRFELVLTAGVRVPAEVVDASGFTTRWMRRAPGAVHYAAQLPRAVGRSEAGVVFSVTHAPLRSPVPVVLMVQDLSFHHHPEHYPRPARARLNALVPAQARRAAIVTTVSEHSRRDLVATYGLDPARVICVPNTVEAPRTITGPQRDGAHRWLRARGVEAPFFVYVGNLHPRKNVSRALRAFAIARSRYPELARHRFVVAGSRWWGRGENEAAAAAPGGSVVLLGRVDDVVREVLLSEAAALVYVSLFEGFGLPPIEAMARGTPVVASDVTSLPEVCGDAALLVDPHDVDAIAGALVRVALEDDLRRTLSTRGRERAAHFTPERTGVALRRALAAAVGEEAVVAR